MQIIFFSSKDSGETRTMHNKSRSIEIMMGSEKNDSNKELSESLLQNYSEGLEESRRGSEFVDNSIDLLYCHLQRISLKRGGSFADSPKWLKNEKATINSKNIDNNCFHYALTVTLKYKNIKKYLQRVSKIKPFVEQYSWNETDLPSHSKGWEKFELIISHLFLIFCLCNAILKK